MKMTGRLPCITPNPQFERTKITDKLRITMCKRPDMPGLILARSANPMLCQLLVLAMFSASALAAGTFEADALPVFRAKCFVCHSGKVRSGGLSLETADEILRGGKSGGAIVPGKPMDSLLLTLVAAGK